MIKIGWASEEDARLAYAQEIYGDPEVLPRTLANFAWRLQQLERDSHPPVLTDVPERVARLEGVLRDPERAAAWDRLNGLLSELNETSDGKRRSVLLGRARQLAAQLHRMEAL